MDKMLVAFGVGGTKSILYVEGPKVEGIVGSNVEEQRRLSRFVADDTPKVGLYSWEGVIDYKLCAGVNVYTLRGNWKPFSLDDFHIVRAGSY